MIQYKRNSEMTSKSSDTSTASSYSSISDDNDVSSLVSLVCSEVEGLTEDLASPPIPRRSFIILKIVRYFTQIIKLKPNFQWIWI